MTALDALNPDTKEEFEMFGEQLIAKINQFNKHTEFPAFAEELINRIAVNRKLKQSLFVDIFDRPGFTEERSGYFLWTISRTTKKIS